MFGEYIKTRRVAKEISLRKFSQLIDVDASNWSKVERGILPPPQDEERLRVIASILNIEEDQSDWQELKDLASIGARMLPDDIASDQRILDSLPVFFRTVRSDKPTPDEIERLIDLLKKER